MQQKYLWGGAVLVVLGAATSFLAVDYARRHPDSILARLAVATTFGGLNPNPLADVSRLFSGQDEEPSEPSTADVPTQLPLVGDPCDPVDETIEPIQIEALPQATVEPPIYDNFEIFKDGPLQEAGNPIRIEGSRLPIIIDPNEEFGVEISSQPPITVTRSAPPPIDETPIPMAYADPGPGSEVKPGVSAIMKEIFRNCGLLWFDLCWPQEYGVGLDGQEVSEAGPYINLVPPSPISAEMIRRRQQALDQQKQNATPAQEEQRDPCHNGGCLDAVQGPKIMVFTGGNSVYLVPGHELDFLDTINVCQGWGTGSLVEEEQAEDEQSQQLIDPPAYGQGDAEEEQAEHEANVEQAGAGWECGCTDKMPVFVSVYFDGPMPPNHNDVVFATAVDGKHYIVGAKYLQMRGNSGEEEQAEEEESQQLIDPPAFSMDAETQDIRNGHEQQVNRIGNCDCSDRLPVIIGWQFSSFGMTTVGFDDQGKAYRIGNDYVGLFMGSGEEEQAEEEESQQLIDPPANGEGEEEQAAEEECEAFSHPATYIWKVAGVLGRQIAGEEEQAAEEESQELIDPPSYGGWHGRWWQWKDMGGQEEQSEEEQSEELRDPPANGGGCGKCGQPSGCAGQSRFFFNQNEIADEQPTQNQSEEHGEANTEFLARVLSPLFPSAKVQIVQGAGGKLILILTGTAKNQSEIDTIARIAAATVGTPGLIVNKMTVDAPRAVRVDAVFARITGADLRGIIKNAATSSVDNGLESLLIDSPVTFSILDNNSPIFANLKQLRQDGHVKFEAFPKLLTLNGHPASINSGDPQFIPAVVSGPSRKAVEHRNFETTVKLLPLVLNNGNIYLDWQCEFIFLDDGSWETRKIDGAVILKAGQTFAISGITYPRETCNDTKEELLILISPRLELPIGNEEQSKEGISQQLIESPSLRISHYPLMELNNHEISAEDQYEEPVNSLGSCGSSHCAQPQATTSAAAPATEFTAPARFYFGEEEFLARFPENEKARQKRAEEYLKKNTEALHTALGHIVPTSEVVAIPEYVSLFYLPGTVTGADDLECILRTVEKGLYPVKCELTCIIAANSPKDMQAIESIMAKHHDAKDFQLITKVMQLQHATAEEISTTLMTCFTKRAITGTAAGVFAAPMPRMIIATEAVENKLSIAVEALYYDEVMALIADFDRPANEVRLQVTVFEVDVTDTPGGLIELGFGRSCAASTAGGFNFTMASEGPWSLLSDFQQQGRVVGLMHTEAKIDDAKATSITMDQFPLFAPNAPRVTANKLLLRPDVVGHRHIGLGLQLTPTIGPDGLVAIRVVPEALLPQGDDVKDDGVFDVGALDTTIFALEGESAVIGGATRTQPAKNDGTNQRSTELLVIVTPHLSLAGKKNAGAEVCLDEDISFYPPQMSSDPAQAEENTTQESAEPPAEKLIVKPFPLKNQSAYRVATAIHSVWPDLFGEMNAPSSLVRVAYDDATNTVFVLATPAGVAQIQSLISKLDAKFECDSSNDLHVVQLKNRLAKDVGAMIQPALNQAVYENYIGHRTYNPPIIPGPQNRRPVQFISLKRIDSQHAMLFEDVHIHSDELTNCLVISAPPEVMGLVLAVIQECDVPPQCAEWVHALSLKKADAFTVCNILSSLATGESTTAHYPDTTAKPSENKMVFGAKLSIDERSKSIIAVGNPNDLTVVQSMIAKLDNINTPTRLTKTTQLHYANADDVVKYLENCASELVAAYNGQIHHYEMGQDIIAVADSVSNRVTVNISPMFYDEVAYMIQQLDVPPKQIQLDVTIAEVDVTDTPGGLINLGFGRSCPTSPLGGFHFNLPSDQLADLVRDLENQGRLTTLSNPRVMTTDNETARLLIGPSGPNQNNGQNGIEADFRDIGIQLEATPTVGPDGTVTARFAIQVEAKPEISPDGTVTVHVVPVLSTGSLTDVQTTSSVFAPAFKAPTLDATLVLNDGESAAIGGVTLARDGCNGKQVTELLVIVTAHVCDKPENDTETTDKQEQAEDAPSEGCHGPWCDDGSELFLDAMPQATSETAPTLITKTIQLHHANAADIPEIVRTFYGYRGRVFVPIQDGVKSSHKGQMVVVAEPVSNQLNVTVEPRDYDDLLELIALFDVPPKQVQIDVTIAEVDVTDMPGGIADLSSDQLIKAFSDMENQDRVISMSKPRLVTADNQAARVHVGQSYPYPVMGATGVEMQYRDIGVLLQATPKINPDGTVTVRLCEELSSAVETEVQIADGVFTTIFNVQTVETTVILKSGEPMTLGGMTETREGCNGTRATEFRVIVTAHVLGVAEETQNAAEVTPTVQPTPMAMPVPAAIPPLNPYVPCNPKSSAGGETHVMIGGVILSSADERPNALVESFPPSRPMWFGANSAAPAPANWPRPSAARPTDPAPAILPPPIAPNQSPMPVAIIHHDLKDPIVMPGYDRADHSHDQAKTTERMPSGQPQEICTYWDKHIAVLPNPERNGQKTPCLFGRMILFGPKNTPVCCDGTVQVKLFDERPAAGGDPALLEIWNISPECLKKMVFLDSLHMWGYDFALPTDACKPSVTHARLEVVFQPAEPKGCAPLFASASNVRLDYSEVTRQSEVPTSLPMLSPVSPDGKQTVQNPPVPLPYFPDSAMQKYEMPDVEVQAEEKKSQKPDLPAEEVPVVRSFALKNQSAFRVALIVQNIWNRFDSGPSESTTPLVRVAYDDVANTVFVQAEPPDLADIASLIDTLDGCQKFEDSNELRIVPVKTALATDLAPLIRKALNKAVFDSCPNSTSTMVPNANVQVIPRAVVEYKLLFHSLARNDVTFPWDVEDTHVYFDARNNCLIIDAPPVMVNLVVAIIRKLDVPPQCVNGVHVFSLKKADALTVCNMLSTMTNGPTTAVGQSTKGPSKPSQSPTVFGLDFTIEDRTNSIIATGDQKDLAYIANLIAKLDDINVPLRLTKVFQLQNAQAADVATKLMECANQPLPQSGNPDSHYQIEQNVIAIAEPSSNKIIVNVSPGSMDDVKALIEELDAPPEGPITPELLPMPRLVTPDSQGNSKRHPEKELNPTQANIDDSASPAQTFSEQITQLAAVHAVQPQQVQLDVLIAEVDFTGCKGGLANYLLDPECPPQVFCDITTMKSTAELSEVVHELERQCRLKSLGTTHITTVTNYPARAVLSECVPVIDFYRGFIPPYRELGVQFEVTPTINDDGTITIHAKPEMSFVAPADIGHGVIAQAINVQTFDQTTVLKKGESMALGFLAKKPDVNDEDESQRTVEYLMIVTPHILATPREVTVLDIDKPPQQFIVWAEVWLPNGQRLLEDRSLSTGEVRASYSTFCPISAAEIANRLPPPPKGEAIEVRAFWDKTVAIRPKAGKGSALAPCLTGRMVLFDKDKQTVSCDGTLKVTLYDERPGHEGGPVQLEAWTIDSKRLAKMIAQDSLGMWTYNLTLPTAICNTKVGLQGIGGNLGVTERNDEFQGRLKVQFASEKGDVLLAWSSPMLLEYLIAVPSPEVMPAPQHFDSQSQGEATQLPGWEVLQGNTAGFVYDVIDDAPPQKQHSPEDFDLSIRTIYVPSFINCTDRDGLELDLTAEVLSQIETTTPYRIVHNLEDADTQLLGSILFTTHHETEFDDRGRWITIRKKTLSLEMLWRDVRSAAARIEPLRSVGVSFDEGPSDAPKYQATDFTVVLKKPM